MLARLISSINQNEGFRLGRAIRSLAVQIALKCGDVEFALIELVDRLHHEISRVDLADGHAFAIHPMPAHGAPMSIAPLWPRAEFVFASEFADCPKQQIALRHDYDVAFFHPVSEEMRHLDRSRLGVEVSVAYSLESYQPIPVKVTSQSRSKVPPDPRQSYRVGGGRRAIPRSDATRGRTLWLSCERSTSFGFDFTHGFSLQRDAIGIVHEAVKDRIGMGRFADHFVPVLDG